jgi:transposase
MQDTVGLSDEVKNYISELKQYKTESVILKQTIENLEEKNRRLEERLRIALMKQFSKHAERYTGEGQQLLFDAGEKTALKVEEKEKDTVTVQSHKRTKRGRKPLDEKLPRKDVWIDIPEEEKQCACGHTLVKIGEEVSERLQIVPQQIFVERIHKSVYACHECEGSGDEDKPAVRTAKTPENIMPGSIATPGLLSFIFVQKYCDYLPFYRQEAIFARLGIELSRQNMSNWQQKICKIILPLLLLIKAHLKTGTVIQMDETTMLVMDEPERKNKQKSYMWLARGGPPDKQAVWYEYHESRASKHITEILAGYSGYLQTDGYDAYDKALEDLLGIITHVGCFAHARRYFYDAMKVSQGNSSAEAALSQIQRLYTVERKLREELKSQKIGIEKFQEERRKQCTPILTAFHDWLEKEQQAVLGSSKLGEAVGYTLNQWPKLVRYLDNVELTPDNNACERSIRPFVMGRKNWVLSGSPEGAQSSCRLYSLIETAKANNRNPYEYLKTVFEQAAAMKPGDDWAKLLPWNLPR